ncbi:NAD+ kinase [Halalkaliarchaeum desulfuricum]|uniref:NAD kinase n=1 Tax=Halalkaliarchaeum desulfuricum TaxID=2055893 RepID=A0A343TID4_9EURY|nr:NAD(+)/NADH kinase [Halalkaliarchaeum desulfuricum]AUX08856.1 NAD+ kinase [Halalkaliarchaeum desulfuricum]
MEVGIVAQRGNARAARLASEIREKLRELDVAVRIDEATADRLGAVDGNEPAVPEGHPVETFRECDLVVSIGGDGTFLFAARGAGGTPVLGVNLGEVGFLNAVSPSEAVEVIGREVTAYRQGELDVREVPRVKARTDNWMSGPAVNDIVVQGSRRGHGGGIDYDLRVDGSLYSGGHADGVLVATQTGSTAYNLSEGGPLVHPSIGGFVVNEMCASGGMPPLVVDGDAEVTVRVTGADRIVVVSDGRNPDELTVPAELTIERSDPPVRLAGPTSDFFEALGKLS